MIGNVRQTVSLITYNIHKGFGGGRRRFLLPDMRQALTRLEPDFLFLQEVQGMHKRRARRIESWPDAPQFEYIADKVWPHYIYAKNAIYPSGHHGNAILSKHPFEHYENINLSRRHRSSRSILHAQVKIGANQRLHLLCVHLGLFKTERASQCKIIMEQIRKAVPEKEPLLMAGDFNDWRYQISAPLAQELGILETFLYLEGRHARSFPAIRPTFCVDRIYFRGIQVENALCLNEKPWRRLSDHLPLLAKFTLS